MENDSNKLNREIEYEMVDEFDERDLEIIDLISEMHKPSDETKRKIKTLIKKKKLKKQRDLFKSISAVTVLLFLIPFIHTSKSVVKIMKHTGENMAKIKVLMNGQKINNNSLLPIDEKTKEDEFKLLESKNQLKRREDIFDLKEELNFEPVVLGKKYKHIVSEMDENGKSDYLYSFYKLDGKSVRVFQRLLTPYTGRVGYAGKMEEKVIDGVNVTYIENVGFEYEREGVVIGVDYEGASYKEYVRIFRDLRRLK